MKDGVAIACYLTDAELQERRRDYLDKLASLVVDATELSNGFSYRFRLEDDTLAQMATVVGLERKCCPFLDFVIKLAAGDEFATLDLTGPEGTKGIVGSLFSWN